MEVVLPYFCLTVAGTEGLTHSISVEHIMSTLVDEYITGIFEAYDYEEKQKFNSLVPASKKKLERLKYIYPNMPSELSAILEKINGTESAWL